MRLRGEDVDAFSVAQPLAQLLECPQFALAVMARRTTYEHEMHVITCAYRRFERDWETFEVLDSSHREDDLSITRQPTRTPRHGFGAR